jgi:hypothetical protein
MQDDMTTSCPIIAGWYTLSFKVTDISGDHPTVTLQGIDANKRFPFKLTIKVDKKKQISKNFFTQYERYNYSSDFIKLTSVDCKITNVLLEKSRPSMKPSVYSKGSYIDHKSVINPGELLEYN